MSGCGFVDVCGACIPQAEALVAQGVKLMNDRNLDEAYETFLKYAVCLCIAYKTAFLSHCVACLLLLSRASEAALRAEDKLNEARALGNCANVLAMKHQHAKAIPL